MIRSVPPPRRRVSYAAAAWLVVAALPSACSAPADNPSAITADEDRQLNEAAAKLDAGSLDAGANTAAPGSNESPAP